MKTPAPHPLYAVARPSGRAIPNPHPLYAVDRLLRRAFPISHSAFRIPHSPFPIPHSTSSFILSRRALSLIELLLAASILAVLAAGAAAVLHTCLQAQAVGARRSNLLHEGLLAMERMAAGGRLGSNHSTAGGALEFAASVAYDDAAYLLQASAGSTGASNFSLTAGEQYRCVTIGIDIRSTYISVAQGEELYFSRTVPVGLDMLAEEAAESLRVDREEAKRMLRVHGVDHTDSTECDLGSAAETGRLDPAALPGVLFSACNQTLRKIGQEAKRSLDYFSRHRRGSKVGKAFLLGEPLPKKMDAYLEEILAVPVAVENVFGRLSADPRFSESAENPATAPGAPWATAAGLALRDEL